MSKEEFEERIPKIKRRLESNISYEEKTFSDTDPVQRPSQSGISPWNIEEVLHFYKDKTTFSDDVVEILQLRQRESTKNVLYRILNAIEVQTQEVKKINQNLESLNENIQLQHDHEYETLSGMDRLEHYIKENFGKLGYLKMVVLSPGPDGLFTTVIHDSNDKVKALHEIQPILSKMEDDFPEIPFEMRILTGSNIDKSDIEGKQIIFKESK